MSSKNGVQTLDKLQERLKCLNAGGKSWRDIAEIYGVPAGTLCSISKGREPKTPKIRFALGLSALLPAPACPTCGVVHIAKKCPQSERKRTPPIRIGECTPAEWEIICKLSPEERKRRLLNAESPTRPLV